MSPEVHPKPWNIVQNRAPGLGKDLCPDIKKLGRAVFRRFEGAVDGKSDCWFKAVCAISGNSGKCDTSFFERFQWSPGTLRENCRIAPRQLF